MSENKETTTVLSDHPYDPSETGEVPYGELCMGDIVGCLDVINLCAKRGAFEASEFEVISILRKRLLAYLEKYNEEIEENVD